jgi:hypothetical protein
MTLDQINELAPNAMVHFTIESITHLLKRLMERKSFKVEFRFLDY